MATHQLHTIQRSLLLLLIQFSSLQLLSLGYTFTDKYFINCGSDDSVIESGKLYAGESNSYPLAKFSSRRSYTDTNQSSSVPSPLHQTARIFLSQNSYYEFQVDTNGTYLLRLHFHAFSSLSNLHTAMFNVSVPGFVLMQNFKAKDCTDSAQIKEFFMKITTAGRFRITFTPPPSSFAFVNAMELSILPQHLIDTQVSRFNNGKLSTYGSVLSRVLETKHRLNVGGPYIPRGNDSLLRSWLPDDTFLANTANAKNSTPYNGGILYQVESGSDGPNANPYTAPVDVYQTAKEKNDSLAHITTWWLPVDTNIDHLIRLHFCDIHSQQSGLTFFNLYINDQLALLVNNDPNVSSYLPAPYYYDLVVRSDDSGLMKIGIQPNDSALVPRAFLNGLEIMKMIDSSDFSPLVDLSNGKTKSKSRKNHLPLVLGPVIGGLVLVFVVGLGLFRHLQIRKQRMVATGERKQKMVATRESSDITNLAVEISFNDLQLATNDFNEEQIIGKGGFGNVYNGVLKNGMRVAVKRSKPGSCQGLPEFHNELMVLSKIRHRNLVSLIGYCDEQSEMILVYEYMEKGTLRDHLYNTNFPSLSWMQRLEICIGAARGLQYLHKGSPGGFIHRDVKSTNILLDENHVAYVSDFGLSRRGPLNHQQYVSTDVKGTFGYLDPEYFRTLKLTEKSDVYSFGVVLLEVLCARLPIDSSLPSEQVNLADWVIFCKSKGALEAIIDPSIKGQIDQNSLGKFSETMEKCLLENASNRPTMGDVLLDLEYALQLHQGAVDGEQHKDSSSIASASLNFSDVGHLASLTTPNEVHDLTIVRGDKYDSKANANFSPLEIDAMPYEI